VKGGSSGADSLPDCYGSLTFFPFCKENNYLAATAVVTKLKLWRSHSLQRKTIVAVVMVGLLPLSLSLVLAYIEERRALRETIGVNFKEIAVEAARRIEGQLSRGVSEAQQLATVPFLRTAVIEANRSYVGKEEQSIESGIRDWQQRWRKREGRQEFPLFVNRIATNHLIRWHDVRRADYVAILVTDNRGALVISSIPQVEYYYGKTAWWQTVYDGGRGQLYVSDPYFDPGFGTYVLNVSAPILEETDNRAVGAVTVLLRRDSLFHAVSEVTIGVTGHGMLLSRDGTVLICPLLSPEEHTVEPALVAQLTHAPTGWAVAGDDAHGGQHAIIGFASVRLAERLAPESLGGKGWLTFVRQDPVETYAPLKVLLHKVAAYGVLVLGVLWIAGVVVAKRITRPIQALHEGVQRFGAGGLDHRLSIKTGDEIEQLADAFNRMAGKVQEHTQEIEETKTYLEDLLENANDVIYTLDREQVFTYVNSKVEAWGYRKEDLIGRPYLSLLSKRHRGRRLKGTLDIGAKRVYEVEVMTRSGELRTAMVSVSPLRDQAGHILGVLGIARDITEMKKLEHQMRSAERLASVGKLAAGVAHEINNPLGGILNCLYNLRKGTLSLSRQEEYLTSMEDGLRRVQRIVRQLLDFSQQHEPELLLTDLNEVVEQVLVLTNHALVANRIRLERQLAPGLPHLMLDRHMIEQVLTNLILNAVQAMKSGGIITIRTRASEESCLVQIEDTGCGIPPEVLPRIFDPFFTTKATGEGTGLGLSVSLGIIERHGGHILVDSEVGKGTVFTIQLPISRDRSMAGRNA
jgi:PAS domain S-box-containing protein